MTEFQNAIVQKDAEKLRNLINSGANVNERTENGDTLLHIAAKQNSSSEIFGILLEHINLALRNEKGQSPFDVCEKSSEIQKTIKNHILQLLKNGKKDEIQNLMKDGWNEWPVDIIEMMLRFPEGDRYAEGYIALEPIAAQIHQAVLAGDLREVKAKFSNTEAAKSADLCGMTLLHKAVLTRNNDILDFLLENAKDLLNLQDNMGRTAYHYAAALDDQSIYDKLSASEASSNEDKNGKTPSYYLENKLDLDLWSITDMAHFIIHLPDLQNKLRELYLAIRDDNETDLKRDMFKRGTTVLLDITGTAAIHKAALYNRTDMIRYLVKMSPLALSVTDIFGRTVLHYLAINQNKQLFDELVKKGADDKRTDIDNLSPIDILEKTSDSSKPFDPELLKEVVELMSDFAEFQEALTIVVKAVEEGNPRKLKSSLSRKRLVVAKNNRGRTLLHEAALIGEKNAIEYIISNFPAAIDCKDHMERTPLHYAAKLEDNGYAYNLLLKAGAKEDALDINGKTPKEVGRANAGAQTADPMTPHPPLGSKPSSASRPRSGQKKAGKRTEIKDDPLTKKGVPEPSSVDAKYLAAVLGPLLTKVLAEVADKRPWDPIEFIAKWLHHHAEGVYKEKQEEEALKKLAEEKEREEQERQAARERRKEEREMLRREKEEKEAKERQEAERLKREKGLATITEGDEEAFVAKERDENGCTDLHREAAKKDGDVIGLIKSGYNLADRDSLGKTPRDHADQEGLVDNVKLIDDYVIGLVKRRETTRLRQLLIDGYADDFPSLDDILDEVAEEEKEEVGEIVKIIIAFKEKVSEVFDAVEKGDLKLVRRLLDRKKFVMSKNKKGQNLLMVAILNRHIPVVEYIIQEVPNSLSARDNLERTPLHYAVAVSEELAKKFLDIGADDSAEDVFKKKPIAGEILYEDLI